jgi:hypothetical protein
MCSNEETKLLTNDEQGAAANRDPRQSEEGLTPLSLPLRPTNTGNRDDSDEVSATFAKPILSAVLQVDARPLRYLSTTCHRSHERSSFRRDGSLHCGHHMQQLRMPALTAVSCCCERSCACWRPHQLCVKQLRRLRCSQLELRCRCLLSAGHFELIVLVYASWNAI